jgi:hypothetical protein
MHQENSAPAQRTHGLTAVPLFHAAWQFAAGIVVVSRVWWRRFVGWLLAEVDARSEFRGYRWRFCG